MQTIERCLETLPERLMIARKRAGFDQSEMALLLGMSRTNYTNIENGKRGISLEIILRLHEQMGLPLDWLMKGEGETPIPQNRASQAKDSHISEA